MSAKRSKFKNFGADLQYYSRLFKAYWEAHFWGLIIIIILALVILVVSILLSKDSNRTSIFTSSSNGILFPLILSIITMGAFLISLSKLEELLGRITSLQQFLEKSNSLIERAGNNNSDLWIVCHYPFIGNLSARGTSAQITFRDHLTRLMKEKLCNVEIVGICPYGLKNYFLQFGKDSRYDFNTCMEAFQELHETFTYTLSELSKINYYGLAYQPPFFLVATKYEAVIASPFFLPHPYSQRNVSNDESSSALPNYCKNKCSYHQNTLINCSIKSKESEFDNIERKVELLGFVTRDPHQISEILEATHFLIRSGCKLDKTFNLNPIFQSSQE
jgi:hypothetical protein